MNNKPSERQRDVLKIIIRLSKKGCPPSLAEIKAELGVSSDNGVRNHIKALIKKGYLERTANVHRGIRVLKQK